MLGDAAEAAELIRKTAKNPERACAAVAAVARQTRPPWKEIVRASESILGRRWKHICQRYGDWGRDGVVAVATRHLGWRLVEVAAEVDGVKYAALAQGVRRFWRLSPTRPELLRGASRNRFLIINES